jgi:hypothetical protein
MKSVFILLVSLMDDEPHDILHVFSNKEKAEKFVKVQKRN